MVSNWFAADTYLQDGRSKSSRPIENNTRVERRGDDIAIKLHDTDVVTFHRDGSVTLDSGGWLTVTTKDRMNRYIGKGVRIGSDRGKWYVYSLPGWTKVCRFFDGITIKDGEVLNPPDPALEARKAEAESKMRKRIDEYVDGYIKLLADGMPVPGPGDCWYCSMFEKSGMPNDDHLQSHLTDKYYVPTLLWNAMKARNYGDLNVVMAMFLDYDIYQQGTQRVRRAWNSTEPDKRILRDFRTALGKYLRKRLIPTVAA